MKKKIKEVKNINGKIAFGMLEDLSRRLLPITSKYIGESTLKAVELKDSLKSNFEMYLDVRTKLCEKYCERDEKGEVVYGEGNVYKFPSDKEKVIDDEMFKLNTTVAEVKDINFKLSDLLNANVELSPDEIIVLKEIDIIEL
jgi:hypothetical protein